MEWFDIPDYPNYKINKLGEIKSIKNNKKLKVLLNAYGYGLVNLHNKNGQKTFLIHRLMAKVFMSDLVANKNLVINHKDLNKLNNSLDNLELVTQKENIEHSRIHGRQKRLKGKDNKRSKKIFQYDVDENLLKVWDSVMDVERTIGIKSNSISNCALGKCKTAKGYKWSYVELKKEGSDDLSD